MLSHQTTFFLWRNLHSRFLTLLMSVVSVVLYGLSGIQSTSGSEDKPEADPRAIFKSPSVFDGSPAPMSETERAKAKAQHELEEIGVKFTKLDQQVAAIDAAESAGNGGLGGANPKELRSKLLKERNHLLSESNLLIALLNREDHRSESNMGARLSEREVNDIIAAFARSETPSLDGWWERYCGLFIVPILILARTLFGRRKADKPIE